MAESIAGMITERILVLTTTAPVALAAVRSLPGLRVAVQAGHMWLRGVPAPPVPLATAIRALAVVASYELDTEGNLFPAGGLTPTGRLPELAWQPIREFVPLELPTAALPAQHPPHYQVQLVPTGQVEPGAAVLTTLSAWKAYAEGAQQVRLEQLRFAVSARQQVLVLGTPLPTVPGQELWVRHDILLPAGLDFASPLLAELVAAKLNPAREALVLFDAAGTWQRVPWSSLQPATRSAIRLTQVGSQAG
ncbi:hypothetical protein [Hymenobacter sp. AT01-02]|uniref:hypothetical protein n=1 Tax=Hymenobacter sp. AT01-02 TaxID=1571877 RepID=UPI00128F0957|nr:hypothetical protein [Hymenobacter sp. AT01-02]